MVDGSYVADGEVESWKDCTDERNKIVREPQTEEQKQNPKKPSKSSEILIDCCHTWHCGYTVLAANATESEGEGWQADCVAH